MTPEKLAAIDQRPVGFELASTATLNRIRRSGDALGGTRKNSYPAIKAAAAANVLAPLADIFGAVGKPWFYRVLTDHLSTLLGCDRYLTMRYSQFAKPAFLVNNFMTGEAEQRYLQSLYRLDPLYRMTREAKPCSVLTLHALRNEGGNAEYCDALFRYACISDELAMMLPLFGGFVIALCFDRETSSFDAASTALALDLYPIVKQANRMHLERSLPGGGYGLLDGNAIAVLVTTAEREILYKNEAWRNAEVSPMGDEIERNMRLGCIGKTAGLGDSVMHGHRLDVSNPIWSDGHIFFIEPQSADSINVDFGTVMAAVARRYRLSPRERELFRMALRGSDSRSIAQTLGLSVGTIKNYKQRLYAKLGIRCEREMASLLIDFLGGGPDARTD